jgi:hypothetical protein
MTYQTSAVDRTHCPGSDGAGTAIAMMDDIIPDAN